MARMPPARFVILHHTPDHGENEAPLAGQERGTGISPAEFEAHWDLMLQQGSVLITWQLARDPTVAATTWPVRARRIQDHRLAYLDYEGAVSRGRGKVKRVDGGALVIVNAGEAAFRIELDGHHLAGTYILTRDRQGKPPPGNDVGQWWFDRLAGDAAKTGIRQPRG